MGSDHLPVIIAFPSVPPPPPTSRRPRWSFNKGDLAKRLAFAAWRKNPTPSLRQRFHYLEAQCKSVILDEKCSAWASSCASLSFSTSVSRAWSFFRKMVHPQPPLTFLLTSDGVLLTTDAEKAECLTTHIHTTLDSPDPVPPTCATLFLTLQP
ncbi:hypothetical protein E2C01_100793 [Portunus trituberculatus]|uniref:Uncharacterized protein n=1 Tax=Portunus trituberculatus TaxID=210409 RepID=A0A5B7KD41_PORTR|nr:hypothetical protein [Portunus trituberculatus]